MMDISIWHFNWASRKKFQHSTSHTVLCWVLQIETLRQISWKEVSWEMLSEAASWGRGEGRSEQSRMEEREKCNAVAAKIKTNPPGNTGARTVFQRCPHSGNGSMLLNSWLVSHWLSFDHLAAKCPSGWQNECFIHKVRICTAHHSIHHAQSLLLWVEEKYSFTTIHKIRITNF